MPVKFTILGVTGFFTTDPSVVSNSRHIERGDYFSIPSGQIYHFQKEDPPVIVEVGLSDVPHGVTILHAEPYNPPE